VIAIPSPWRRTCVIVHLPRDQVDGPSLKDTLPPEMYAVVEAELDREEARVESYQAMHKALTGLTVTVQEFDCG
jgi:hypothetical protein